MRDDGWREWMSVILERAIAQGKSEDQALHGILEPKRQQVRELYRELKAKKEAEVAA